MDGYSRLALDGLNGTSQYIIVSGQSARAGSLAAIPGESKNPGFDLPYPYFHNVRTLATNVTSTPIPASQDLLIEGNILGKSLRETGNFSEYGFGLFWMRAGEMDLDLSALTRTRNSGVYILGSGVPLKNLVIRGNQFFGLSDALTIATPGGDGHDITFENNDVKDVISTKRRSRFSARLRIARRASSQAKSIAAN